MTTPTYPAAGFDIYYGCGVWQLGEDGDQFLVSGHGRRAVAALSAHLRYLFGHHQTDVVIADKSLSEGHALFVRECGCSAEQHAQHLAEDLDCMDDCHEHGLPPCRDDWAWIAHPAKESPDSLPVLWVRL